MKIHIDDLVRFRMFKKRELYVGRVARTDSAANMFYKVSLNGRWYLRQEKELEKLTDEESMLHILESK